MERLKQIFEIIESKGISIDEYKENDKLCGYELNTYTDGGVNQIIFLDFRHNGLNANEPKDFIQEFKSYVQSIDIDDEIDLHRQDIRYKQAFTITQSVRDFKNWKKALEVLIKSI